MPELPPTNPASKPTEPDEPERTGLHHSATPHISVSDDIATGTVIAGKYKLLEAIGEGGMGAVWMAQQIEPVKRHVAVKLIRSGMDSKSVVARFEAERQALSMMDHPNIARVFDVGTTANGRPFFVMELVKGTPITDFCDQRKLTPRQRLELFVPVCLAIQHAHQKGIIHRDIKPSNVLVALHDDKPVPKVIDFGVAKATGFTLTEKTLHTGFEQVVGTPAYMSPEQATFNQLDIDTRSDVYSLGVLLYELLTGTTPIERQRFKQAALLEMLRVVREEEPPRPSTRLSSTETKASIAEKRGTEPARLSRELRTELDWVVMKSLEKDRVRRYATAVNFAEDVQRYLGGEAVQAHPPSASYRVRKFVRKHRAPVAAAAAILLGLVGGAVGTVYGMIKADGEQAANALREQAEQERDAKEAARVGEMNARNIAEKALDGEAIALAGEKKAKAEIAFLSYVHSVDLALREYQVNNIARARELLESCSVELRGWEWRYVHRLCHAELLLLRHSENILSASFSGDGRRVVTASLDKTARIWDTQTGKELAILVGHTAWVRSASFSGDGRRVVTESMDKTARVWDAASGGELAILKGHTHPLFSASFSRDGRRVVTASSDNTTRVWDAETGQELVLLKGTGQVDSASFSVDGRRVLTVSGDFIKTARQWDAATGKELATLKGDADELRWASFSGDGRRLVTLSDNNTAQVWDAETGNKLVQLKGHAGYVRSASFSADGSRVVTASQDNTARVWDAESGKELVDLKGHTGHVRSAFFSADDRRILTASYDDTARVWDSKTGAELALVKDVFYRASLSEDGCRIVTVSTDRNTAKVWDADAKKKTVLHKTQSVDVGEEFARPEKTFDTFTTASSSGDGRRIVTASWEHVAHVWDVELGKESAPLKGHTDIVSSASFSIDGRRIVTASHDQTARVWNGDTGKELVVLKGHTGIVFSATFSGDGRRVVTAATTDNTARVWDSETGKELIRLQEKEDWSHWASLSWDGRRVVTSSNDDLGGSNGKTARVWDVATGKELARLQGHTTFISSASFSVDGRRIVTVSGDNTARVWDAETGKGLALLKCRPGRVVSASFSADGRRVVTATDDGTIRVWDSESGKLILTFSAAGNILRSEFSPDDSMIRAIVIDGDENDSIRIINYDTRPTRETFRKYLEAPPPRPVR